MTTVDKIITRLQKDFDCRLTVEQMLSIMNILEKRLAIDIIRKTQTKLYPAVAGRTSYPIDIKPEYITRVFVNDREIKKRHAYNAEGYVCEDGNLVFLSPLESGTLYVEHIVIPDDILEADIANRTLFVGNGYDEIYIYHILSREALMSGNIEMLNNYSLIYAEALNSLKAAVALLPKGQESDSNMEGGDSDSQNAADKYKNIW